MEALINRYRNLTVLLVVIMAQLLLLAYQVKTSQDVRLIRVWAVTAVTPLARVLEFARRNTIGIAEDYFVLVKVREENRRLSDENGKLKLENQFLRTELQTAERARLLSAFQERTPSRTLPARIIGNATGSNARVVFIDRGSVNGVMRGMAVVTPEGIVGKVLAAYPTASQVQLITDGTFAAGVISQKNRVYGTLKGTGQSKCVVDYVQNEEKVEPGEMFYTSGDDRVFPKGMPVGTVSVVKQGKNFKDISVVPTAFQQGLEEVLVVLEGVHQGIPDRNATAATPVKILPPPPAEQPGQTSSAGSSAAGTPVAGAASGSATDLRSGLSTTADRLKERYKRIGEMQGHTFGEGLPGSRPPDFTMNPDAPKARPQPGAAPSAAGGTPATGGTTANTGGTAAPAPAKPAPGQQTGTTSATAPQPVGNGTLRPPTAASPVSGQPAPSGAKPAGVVKPSVPATTTAGAPTGSTSAARPPVGTAGTTPAGTPSSGTSASKPTVSPSKPATAPPSANAAKALPSEANATTAPAKPAAAKPKAPDQEAPAGASGPTGERNRTAAPQTPATKTRRPQPEGLPFP